MLLVSEEVAIDEAELEFEFARSSGPGGQNVNKVETKVTLRFSVADTTALTASQKDSVFDRLRTRITRDGVLRVTSQRHRTREANRRETIDRFVALLAGALEEEEPRRPTRIPKVQRRRRLQNKRQHAEKKRLRARPEPGE